MMAQKMFTIATLAFCSTSYAQTDWDDIDFDKTDRGTAGEVEFAKWETLPNFTDVIETNGGSST